MRARSRQSRLPDEAAWISPTESDLTAPLSLTAHAGGLRWLRLREPAPRAHPLSSGLH